MSVSFNVVGKMSKGKETEKFKPHDVVVTESYERLRESFSLNFGTNSVFAQVSGFKPDDKREIKLFMKSTYENGKEIKHDPRTMLTSEVRKHKTLNAVADFAKFVFDPLTRDQRKTWNAIKTAIKNDESPTSEQLSVFGFETVDDFKAVEENPFYERREFAFAWDFGNYIDEILEDPNLNDKKYHITGDYAMSYYNGKFYNSYDVRKIIAADDDEKESGTLSLKMLFNEESADASALEETGRIAVNGWTMSYAKFPGEDKGGDKPFPFSFNIVKPDDGDVKGNKRYDLYKKWFTVDRFAPDYQEDAIYEMGIVCDIVNGTSFVPFSIDCATEEEREMYEMDMIDLEDLMRKYGRFTAGPALKEFVVKKPARGYTSGNVITSYKTPDMHVFEAFDQGNEGIEPEESEDIDNLFDED